MNIFAIVLSLVVSKVVARRLDDFAVDYFLYKRVASVVVLNLEMDQDNLSLMQRLNYVGIMTSSAKIYRDINIHSLANTQYHKVGVFVDGQRDANRTLYSALSEAGCNRMFDELHHWLVITAAHDNLRSLIDDSNFDLSTDFVLAVAADGYKMYDLYNPSKAHGLKLNVTFMGTWTEERGLRILLTQSKYARRANLQGMIWRVAYLTVRSRFSKYKPSGVLLENHLKDLEKTGTKDNLAKFGYSVVSHLAEKHNATMVLRQYGLWRKGDTVGPLTRALHYGEVDITGTVISVTGEKIHLVKFVYNVWPTCFMLRSPQPNVIKMRQIFGQFDSSVWRTSALVALLSFLGLALTFHLRSAKSSFAHCSDSGLILVGCICLQCTQLDLNNLSTRVAFLSTMLFSSLMYNYYSASVVCARLSDTIVKMPDSLLSLAQSKLTVASEPMIYFDFLMKDHGRDADYFNRTKWQKVPEADKFMLPEKGMQLAKTGGFAYHTHPDVGYPYVNRLYDNRQTCELTEVHLGRLTYRSIAVAYNSSFAEIARVGFAWMSEVGIRHRQLVKWTSRKPRCRSDILSAASITIYEFAPQLIILSFGLWLAMTICIGEIIADKYNMPS
ncbi:ionotropic receptor 75a-like isoform X2 [Phymastichus coffea]|uniref:ionotropic receptor 75a-like isoform X2 n=1 Tax=Phymastichus coffea TaxID=108790 RepID=UPI00273BAD96|nr:ionotropic receptor 75a-like isoform X2 [Phymastichus coffea]